MSGIKPGFKRFLLAAMAVYSGAHAQEKCTYTKLSNKYNFTITFNKSDEPTNGDGQISDVTVTITNKADKKVVQKIPVKYDGVDNGYYCTSRSYVTGYNQNAPVEEGDVGDIIVADLNFDGKEDFAVKIGAYPTGAGTEWFAFYLQTSDGKFVKDNFLTTRMKWFPVSIDAKNHLLTAEIAIGADVNMRYSKFRYNTTTGKWAQVK